MNKDFLKRFCTLAAALAVFAVASHSQEKKESDSEHKIVHFGDLKWTPIIKGCDLAPVSGDPNAMEHRSFCAFGVRTEPRFRRTGIPRMKM
jgi:hypothetical protein